MVRITWYVPVMIWSPSLRPLSTSMSVEPVMPVSTLRNVALPLATTNTPCNSSLRAFSATGSGLVAARAPPELPVFFGSRSPFWRTVSA